MLQDSYKYQNIFFSNMWIDFIILGLSILFIFTAHYLSLLTHGLLLLFRYRLLEPRSYTGKNKRILVVGDSLAVGCGAEHSIAYWLHYYTGYTIDVIARSGATVLYLEKNWPKKKYDHYVLLSGGNDIWKCLPIHFVIDKFKKFYRHKPLTHVLVYDIRKSSALPWILKFCMHYRQKMLRSELSSFKQDRFIDLYTDKKFNEGLENHSFLSMDGIHPSSLGNQYIARKLVLKINKQ